MENPGADSENCSRERAAIGPGMWTWAGFPAGGGLLRWALARNVETKRHCRVGQIHRTDKALPVPRHQDKLADVVRFGVLNVAHEKHRVCPCPVESSQHEKRRTAHAFKSEGVVSRTKHAILPAYFMSQSEDAVCVLGRSQSRLKGNDAHGQNRGICEFANRSHEISLFVV